MAAHCKITVYTIVAVAIALILIIIIPSVDSYAANYPLEIIQPRAGLDTKNRFYKAYPGLEYEVRVAVIGGDYPYSYSLTTAPSGMTIADSTGVITWPNPTTTGSPHTVTAQVDDLGASGGGDGAGGSTVTVSWTITVTTSGFVFLDSVNGSNANSGTEASPYRTVAAIHVNGHAGDFAYFKNGNYSIADATASLVGCYAGQQSVWRSDQSPIVWMAFPGHSPTYSLAAFVAGFFGSNTNTYIEGITFDPITNGCRWGFNFSAGASDVTFRKNTFRNLTNNHISGGNQSQLFISAGGPGSFYAIVENTFFDVDRGYHILGYTARKVLVADNTFDTITDSDGAGGWHSIGPKGSCQRWHIINNRLVNIEGDGIWLYYGRDGAPSFDQGDHEVAYNLVQMIKTNDDAVLINESNTNTGGPIYLYRNTFMTGHVDARHLYSGVGPFTFTHNVVVNENTEHIGCDVNCIDSSRIVEGANLEGRASDNIVDQNGNLTSAFSSFVGTRGYQVTVNLNPDIEPPAPPTNLSVQ